MTTALNLENNIYQELKEFKAYKKLSQEFLPLSVMLKILITILIISIDTPEPNLYSILNFIYNLPIKYNIEIL
jgi:hypothetical protein